MGINLGSIALASASLFFFVALLSSAIEVYGGNAPVVVYQELFRFSGIASPDRIVIDELRLRVVDASTNQTVDRGVVTLYFALWYGPGETWVVCEVDRRAVMPNGTVVFAGNYSCGSFVRDPETWSNILRALATARAAGNASYILVGYSDPRGYYVSEPQAEAYFVYNGFSDVLYATFIPLELLPAGEPLPTAILLPVLIIYFILSIKGRLSRGAYQ